MLLPSLWPSRNGHRLIEDLSFLVHESEEAYRVKSRDYLDSEQLGDFREDAFLFHKRQRGLVPPERRRDANVDYAAQVRVLRGPEYYQNQYAFAGPIDPRDGNPFSEYSTEYRQWVAQQTKPVLTPEQADLIEHIAFGYRAHDGARELLSDGVAHGVVRSRYCGIPCQARIDWLNPKRGVVAVMTCDRFRWRDSHIRDNGLVHELAFHRALLAQVAGRRVPVQVIAFEKQMPHRCGVWTISERLLRGAQKDNEKALTQLQECRWLNRWPTGYERVRKLAPIGIFA
jgi:hypothetical protein